MVQGAVARKSSPPRLPTTTRILTGLALCAWRVGSPGSGMTPLGFEFSISCALSLNKAFTHSVPQLPHL